MKISRDQYEVWFLDYLEGNLDESLMGDFRSFLRENPDLAEELKLYEPVGLPEEEMVFPGRKKLYKQSFDIGEVFETTAVGLMEGDLTPETQHSFEKYLADHPEKSREMMLFRHTRLQPDFSVVYADKHRLFRAAQLHRNNFFILVRVAAIVLLALIIPVALEQHGGNRSGTPYVVTTGKQSPDIKVSAERPEKGIAATPGARAPIKQPVATTVVINSGTQEYNEAPADPVLLAWSGRNEFPSLLTEEKKAIPHPLPLEEPALVLYAQAYDLLAVENSEEMYLSDKLAKKIGLTNLNMGKVVRWGLTVASGLTRGKFNYSTSESGDIIALNLDTRLVGFSIPVNEKQPVRP